MTENDEFVPNETSEEGGQEAGSSRESGFSKLDVGGKEILTEVLVDEPTESAATSGLAETPEGSIPGTDETQSIKEPSRFQIFLRRTLIWFGVVAAAFLAGYLTFYFVLFRPAAAELEAAQGEIVTLQADFDSTTSQLEALTDADQHRALLQVLVNTYDARLALTEENVVAAKAALTGTPVILDEVIDKIAAFDSGLAETLPSRLALIRTNLDRDIETAIADCDQLIEDLQQVEQALYP